MVRTDQEVLPGSCIAYTMLPAVTADQAYACLCTILARPLDTSRSLGADDWSILADLAQREGVAALLHYCLDSGSGLEEVPDNVRQSLRDAYHSTGVANMLLYHELEQIVEELQEDGEPPLVLLKGAALAETIYPNIGLRSFGDLDLLLPEEKLPGAVRCLKALGYVEPYPDLVRGLNALVGHHVHLRGSNRDPGTTVELHWSLIGGRHDWRTPSLPWFWEQTEPLQFSSAPASSPQSLLTLNPTAHLLYLCAHLMLQHGEAGSFLCWFYDIHLLLEKERARLDWEELAVRGREFGWAPAVSRALEGVQERFQTRIPTGFLESLSNGGWGRASKLVASGAETDQTRATRLMGGSSALSPSVRLRLLFAVTFPSPAYMRWRYRPRPAWLWPLFYPYRWFDMVREGVVTVVGKLASPRHRRD